MRKFDDLLVFVRVVESGSFVGAARRETPSGLLRIAAPYAFGLLRLEPMIHSFQTTFPAVRVELAEQRVSSLVAHGVLASVLDGFNEQINCDDCVSAFGSVDSRSAVVHREPSGGSRPHWNAPPFKAHTQAGRSPNLPGARSAFRSGNSPDLVHERMATSRRRL